MHCCFVVDDCILSISVKQFKSNDNDKQIHIVIFLSGYCAKFILRQGINYFYFYFIMGNKKGRKNKYARKISDEAEQRNIQKTATRYHRIKQGEGNVEEGSTEVEVVHMGERSGTLPTESQTMNVDEGSRSVPTEVQITKVEEGSKSFLVESQTMDVGEGSRSVPVEILATELEKG